MNANSLVEAIRTSVPIGEDQCHLLVENPPLLVIESLQKRFGEVMVLRGITASVERGAITAFVGPNGAGKTTLFHVVTGDVSPDGGAVFFDGQAVSGLPPWKVARLGIGKMFQDVRVFEHLTVIENVLLSLHDHPGRSLPASLMQAPFRKSKNQQEVGRAKEFLAMAGVPEPWGRDAKSLSFGNQKLLALARLIAGRFRLLLLDEPTAGVAPAMAERISELLLQLVKEQGATIALIEHNFSFVESIAVQTYLLRDGAVMDSGLTAHVLGKEENREVLIGL